MKRKDYAKILESISKHLNNKPFVYNIDSKYPSEETITGSSFIGNTPQQSVNVVSLDQPNGYKYKYKLN